MNDQQSGVNSNVEFSHPNILQSFEDKATAALQLAADNLCSAADAAGIPSQDQLQDFLTNKQDIYKKVSDYISNLCGGSLKGPVITALDNFNTYFDLALHSMYNFNNTQVVNLFAQFLLAVATEGWEGRDTTGTTIGNNTQGETSMGAFFEGK